jgi:hypothetical protein
VIPTRPSRQLSRAQKVLPLVACSLVLALFPVCAVQAVVIDSGKGQSNTRAPHNDPGWGNIGTIDYMTGVYLGNHWVLTAWHVGAKPIKLGGRLYEPAHPGMHRRAVTAKNLYADLIVFQVREKPDLPPIAIASKPVEVGQFVLMAGNGKERSPRRQMWDATWQPVHPKQAVYSGYQTLETHRLRWGTNRVAAVDLMAPTGEKISTKSFATSFDIALPTPHEAQASSGDSGGPIFTQNEKGEWVLSGIMMTVLNHPNQPRNVVAYGNATYAVDLYSYREFINEVVLSTPDRDKDKVLDILDNCPVVSNPGQEDSNGNGTGDACEEPPDSQK